MARRPRVSTAALCAASAALVCCAEIERQRGAEPLRRSQTVARQWVTVAGGGVVIPSGGGALHRALRVEFPPGSVPEDTEVEVIAHYGDPRLPSVVQSFEIRPIGLALTRPASVSIEYAAVYDDSVGSVFDAQDLALYSFVDDPRADGRAHQIEGHDEVQRVVTTQAGRLGTFFVLHEPLHALFVQPTRLIDPTKPLMATVIDGQLALSDAGPVRVPVGRGSIAAFWSGTAERNLLVLPGLMVEPQVVMSPGSILPQAPAAGLNEDFDNIVVFWYPSGQSLRDSANRLYDLIAEQAGPGFGCRILAHGSGGLVARYALERAHQDPTRAGYADDDPPLAARIDRVVFVGTPNQGASVISAQLDRLLEIVLPADRVFVQGVIDLLPEAGSFVADLNRGWVEPPTEYFTIAGDVAGGHSDGLVAVNSALGVPAPSSRPDAYQVFSGPIYDHHSLLVFADRIGVVEQARDWFGKSGPLSTPAIGSVETPQGAQAGIVELPFSLSDAQQDVSFVDAVWSIDGTHWRRATSADGPTPLALRSAAAPGEPQTFRWDSRADQVGVVDRVRVVLRLLVADHSGTGIAGQTGGFIVDN